MKEYKTLSNMFYVFDSKVFWYRNKSGFLKNCTFQAPPCTDICPKIHNPMCGTDGKTYSNKCLLQAAGRCQHRNLAVSHPGPCSPVRTTCNAVVDIGFLLDSSGSIRLHYKDEKRFLKAIARTFHISETASHVGVITFSDYAEHTIKLKDHYDISSFG